MKNIGNSSRGRSQGVPKIQGPHVYGASRGHLYDSAAFLSHSYLFNRADQPRCTYCDCALTVVHMLLECPHYSIVRQRYFSVTTLKDIFETVITHTILDFIKEIGFYNRI